jgi:hypothetical protein
LQLFFFGLVTFYSKELERSYLTYGDKFFLLLFFGERRETLSLKKYSDGFDLGFYIKFDAGERVG